MAGATIRSDKEVGLAVLFCVLGLVGALSMLVGGLTHSQLTAGLGFAGAMLAGAIAVAVIHLFA